MVNLFIVFSLFQLIKTLDISMVCIFKLKLDEHVFLLKVYCTSEKIKL